MKKSKKANSSHLDIEEKDILTSFEKNEWKSIKDIEKGKADACKNAKETLRKKNENV